MKKTNLLLTLILLFAISSTKAQHEKCATMPILEAQYLKDPSLKQRMAENEQKLQEYINQKSAHATASVISIPVVFHIIHNGESIGTGNNIDDATIMYQLQRINDDFRKLNADTLTSSDAFYSDQADSEIEFCLAKRDPSGNSTTGITRHERTEESFTIDEIDTDIKPSTIWDKDKYINIWCVNLIDPGSPGVDGYGTFPDAGTSTTDGVVVANFAFGYSDDGGKTIVLTHELGHYLNLIHIWGDDVCGDDLVSDTPPAEESNSGCPTYPHNVAGTCNPGVDGEMFMNYMDYSDAVCTVMFTEGQKTRMRATLANTRLSLTTSDGCTEATGIRDLDYTNGFNLYPNPTNSKITIENSNIENSSVNVKLYNQLGSLVKDYSAVNKFPFVINVSELPVGIYSLTLNSEQKTAVKKIVISK